MGYAFYSMTGHLFSAATPEAMKGFLSGYQGLVVNQFFSTLWPAYIFFLLTFFVNFYFIYKGVSGGIEILSRYGMPLLIVIALFLVVRVFTMGAPVNPDWNIWNALGFVWNPDFGELRNPRVWLEAAGQIFFTLSVGMGCVQTYASYLREKDDIVLSGLSTASTNEFCEVILGGSIVIPAAFLFFGPVMAREVAHSGTFNIGFVTMPLVFHQVPFGTIFSVCWFLLLFIAGITSSVALIQPAMAFLEDEFQLTRKRATFVLGSIAFVLCHLPILFFGNGLVDELDFWAGTFLLVLFATIEFVLFAWVFGIKKGWHELHIGALIRIPKVYRFIITWITPVFLILLLGMWTWDAFGPIILMHDIPVANRLCAFGVRLLVMGVLAVTCVGVAVTWKRDKSRKKGGRV
jgi:SNF family Na+-dependent transporter